MIKFIKIFMLPYALLTILMIGYGIFSLTVPMFNSEKSFNHE